MKQRYAKVEDGKLKYLNAPAIKTARGTVFNPSAATLAGEGYYPVPETESGKFVISWSVVDNALVPTYGERPPVPHVPRVKRYSKLKVVAALMKADLWAQVKAWIDAAGLTDLYLAAQNFAEDNEYFTQGVEQLKAQLGLTDEQIEGILANCEADY